MAQLYHVTTEGDCEGRSTRTLAYATGDKRDIEVFYDRYKMYKIRLEPINIVHIDPANVKERRELLDEKDTLESRLQELDTMLKKQKSTIENRLKAIDTGLKVTR